MNVSSRHQSVLKRFFLISRASRLTVTSLLLAFFAICVMAFPKPTYGAEIIGSWVSGTTHTAETGTNRALIFTAHVEHSSTASLTSVSYGGQSMTRIIDHNYAGATTTAYVAAFILDEAGIAAATSSDFAITWASTPSETPAYSSVFLQNVYQTTLTGDTATGGSTSSSAETAAVSTNADDMAFVAATCGTDADYSTLNGFTEAIELAPSSADGICGYLAGTGGSVTPGVSHTSVDHQGVIGFVVLGINQPPALDPVGNKSVNEGSLLEFTISATDPDTGDTLTYSATNLPSGATFDAGTQTFSWTPDYTQAGTYDTVTFTVTDDGMPAESDSETITITVNDVNQPPTLDPIGNKTVNEGQLLEFTVTASDPDTGDSLTYSATNLPAGATFDTGTQTFSWTPDYTQAGTYDTVTFTVEDNGSPIESDSETITVTVNDVNQPPVLTPIGNKTVNEGGLLEFTVSASDPDTGDSLTYSATNLPTGATFDAGTQTFSWTPDYTQAGTYDTVTFTVEDNGSPIESDSETIAITVNNVNRSPVLDPIGNKTTDEGVLLEFTVSATDPDGGDSLILSANNLPTGAGFIDNGDGTGRFSWTPDYTQSGTYDTVTFTVTDNGSPTESDSETITITVSEINRPPVLDPIGNKTVDEGQPLEFTITATDPDSGDILTYSATNLPTGATFDAGTQTFSWTPDYTQAGTYDSVTFTVEDNGSPVESDSETITITVNEINRPPVLDPIGNKNVNEGSLLEFTISASDPDTGDSLTYSATNLPTGATFDAGTQLFSWTPDYTQAGTYDTVTFTVEDNGSPIESDSETITITVNNVNQPPVLDPIGNKTTDEGALLAFTISATDPDSGDILTYSATNLPTGATFDAGTQTFSWTPDYTQAGTYDTVTFTVEDNGSPIESDSETIAITVNNVNRSPVLDPVGNKTTDEGVLLEFTLSATDPDTGDTLTLSANNLPTGATLTDNGDGTGLFSWTPDYTQSGTYDTVTFTVTDNGSPTESDLETITVTVNEINRSPVLDPIGNQSVAEGSQLQFTVTATDPDTWDTLTYAASNLPPGASFTAGTFSWTPDHTQAGTYLDVTFIVTDNGTPQLSDSEAISITVTDVNQPPVLDPIGNKSVGEGELLEFVISASDPDAGNTLTYSATNLPSGATFDAGTRTFSWTPQFGQEGSYPDVTFTVTDDGTPVESDSEAITITVGDVNQPPALDPIGDKTVDEGVLLAFTISATDPDTGDSLTYSVTNLPTGATFDSGTQTFSWTPDYTQAGTYDTVTFTVEDNGSPIESDSETITITVNNVNRPPVLDPVGNKTVDEGQLLEFIISATDPDSGNILTYSATNLPSGATFDPATRTFSWTPDHTQSGTYDTVTFSVNDNGSPVETDSETITITVGDVNVAPVLDPVGDKTVDEGVLLSFTISATDPDTADSLTLSATNLPTGATLADNGDGTGLFSWTPDYTQSGTYDTVTFTATDNGSPTESDSETITVTVNEINRTPVLSAIGNQSVDEGQLLEFTISATDPDTADSLTLSANNLPTGATLTDNGDGTGLFSWTPDYIQSGSYTNVSFTVTDNGTPNLSDSEAITITVNDTNRPPVLSAIGDKTVDEGSGLLFGITATDPDGDYITLTATNMPTGAELTDNGDGTGIFSWTPDYTQSGSYSVTITATDDGTPAESDFEAITITVNDVNQAPALNAIGTKSVDEGQLLQFTVSATDPDASDILTYSATGLPSGATFDPATRIFSWTPDHTQSGSYAGVTFTVEDNGTPILTDSEVITITVNEVNQAPALNAIGNKTVDEGQLLEFTVSAADPDTGDSLTLSANYLPTGATLTDNGDGTGLFSWTPDYIQSGSYTNVSFTVTDNGTPNLNDSETITITVNEINRVPVLDPVGNQSVNEGALLEFTVTAADPDTGDALTYSAGNLPTGATFDPSTQVFSWTPDFTQSGSYPDVIFTVEDNGTPVLSDSETITITVNEINRAPVLDPIGNQSVSEGELLEFTVTASDPDTGDVLTYSAANLPTGATFDPATRIFSWTPDFTQTGSYSGVTFTVTDDGSPVLNASEAITITVGDANQSPTLDPIGNKTVDEGQLLEFTISATDPDTADSLTLSANNLPTGATLTDNGDGTGLFSWTPDYIQSGSYTNVSFTVTDNGTPNLSDSEAITITVNDTNRPPVLSAIGDKTVDEGSGLLFGITATDPDGDIITLTATNMPTGAELTDNGDGTGIFSWTPDYTQSGGYSVTITATDDGTPTESDFEAITITVNDVNRVPALNTIGDQSVAEGQLLEFTVSATDPDTGDVLTYSATGLPAGATFDPATQVFSWTPDNTQSGSYPGVTFTVEDNGTPVLSDSEAITITVTEDNRAPVLDPIGDRSVDEGQLLEFTVSATDPDTGDSLTLSANNLPTGATLTDNGDGTGLFSWTPDYTQSGSYTNVSFTVTDDGTPNLNDSETITITVNDVPVDSWYVDASAPSSGFGTSWATAFKTISEALAAADPGNTIFVNDGTYSEDLLVTTPGLTLQSVNGRDNTTIQLGTGAGILIDGTADNFTLGGTASAGFTILSSVGGGTTNNVELINGPSNVEISYNRIDTTGDATIGVSVGSAGASGLTISNNDFIAEAGDGSVWGAKLLSVTLSNNVFTGPGGSPTSGYAVELAGVTGTSLISNNSISGYAMGIAIFNGEGTSGLTITGNTISGCGNGIRLGQYSPTIHGDMTTVTVSQNLLLNNDIGLVIDDGANVVASFFTVEDNEFEGNTIGLQNDHTTEVVDATNNWWGHASGPYHPVTNPDGQGDEVSDNVTYSPWVSYGTWYVDAAVSSSGDGTSWATAYKTIGEALTSAVPGNTIIVNDGTYAEDLGITTSNLTIRSVNGEAFTTISGQSGTAIRISGNADDVTLGSPGMGFRITGDPINTNYLLEIAGGESGVTIEGNHFDTTGSTTQALLVNITGATDLIIRNNVFDVIEAGDSAIDLSGGITNLLVHENTISGPVDGNAGSVVFTDGIYINGATVTNNTITQATSELQLGLGMMTGITYSGNTFNQTAGAILVQETSEDANQVLSHLSVTDNLFTASTLDSYAFLISSSVEVEDVDFTSIAVNNKNDFRIGDDGSNTYETVSNYATGTATLDATNNWWGDITGPYHPVTNPDGLGETVSNNVDFDPWITALEPDFKGSPTSGEIPLTVQFTDLSTGNVTDYLWDFGDGQTSTAQNPAHQYLTAGTYTVTLTVTGPNGSVMRGKIDYIHTVDAPPLADFTASPSSGFAPLSVQFTDLSTGTITDWYWDFGDGQTSTAQHPLHEYQSAGDYTVTLKATGPGGSYQKIMAAYVHVSSAAVAAEFSATPTSGAAPLSVQFTDESLGTITDWYWDFGDGQTSTAQNPSHQYQTEGSYTVQLTVNGSDTRQRVEYIHVGEVPASDFTADPLSGVVPLSVQFNDLSTGTITDWYWDFGDGQTSTEQNPLHTYDSVGDFTVQLTVNGSYTQSRSSYIHVGEAPPESDFTADPTTGSTPLTVQFTDLSIGDITSWSWNFGDGTYSAEQNPVHEYQEAGTFDVSLTVSGPGGAESRKKFDYITSGTTPPVADFSGSPTTGIHPLEVQFTDASSGTITDYLWDFGDGQTSTQQHPRHYYQLPGLYTVSLTVTGPGGSDLRAKVDYVEVNPGPPAADFSANPTIGITPLTTQFTNLSTGYIDDYLWDFGDGTTSTLENPSHQYQSAGLYTVQLTANGPGGSDVMQKTDYIYVSDGPIAGFTANPRTGPRALTVQFIDLSLGSISGYYWEFGDGETSTLQDPLHTYDATGDYTVRLTVTGANGTDMKEKVSHIHVGEKTLWANTYGSPAQYPRDKANAITQTSDGGYIVVGSASTVPNMWVLKLHSDGIVAWENIYPTNDDDEAFAVVETADGGYVVAGYTNAFGTGGNDIWVLKLQSHGAVEWQRTYGGSGDDEAYAIQQTLDGGFIMAGTRSDDLWVLKLRSNGFVEWEKSYGDGNLVETARSIQQTADGGYIVGGMKGLTAFWVLKLYSDGNVEWQKIYNPGGMMNHFGSIEQTADGGYVFAGEGRNGTYNQACVLKLNSDGTIAWQKAYGGQYIDGARSIQQTADNGYIVAGFTRSFDTIPLTGQGSSDFWLFKLNSDGSIAWEQAYGDTNTEANLYLEEAQWVEETTDADGVVDGYVMAGYTEFHGDAWRNFPDYWVLKVDVNGQIPGCAAMGNSSAFITDLSVYTEDTTNVPVVTGILHFDTNVSALGTSEITATTCSVDLPSDAAFSATPTTGTSPLTVYFTDESTGNITDWFWDFGDGETSTLQHPSHTYQTSGNYTVSLTITTSDQGSDTETKTDYIQIPKVADFAADTTSGNLPLTVQFVDNSSGQITDWYWEFGDGATSRETHPRHTYTEPGVFTVSLTISGPSLYDSETKTDYIQVTGGIWRDAIAVLNVRLSTAQKLVAFNAPTSPLNETGDPIAHDGSFGTSDGSFRILSIAGVNVDDGGGDEIAALNVMQDGTQRLLIFNAPSSVYNETGEPIAYDTSFGTLTDDWRMISIAGVDIDGDGIDEIAALNRMQNDNQRLLIFNAPTAGQNETGMPIAYDTSMGSYTSDWRMISIAGVDIDGDGIDEIAALNRMQNDQQRLLVFNAPTPTQGEVGYPIAYDVSFGSYSNDWRMISIAGVDTNKDGIDEVAALNVTQSDKQQLLIFNAPTPTQGEVGGPISYDTSLGSASTDEKIISIAPMRHYW